MLGRLVKLHDGDASVGREPRIPADSFYSCYRVENGRMTGLENGADSVTSYSSP